MNLPNIICENALAQSLFERCAESLPKFHNPFIGALYDWQTLLTGVLSARIYCGFKSSVKDASRDLRANGSHSNATVRTWPPHRASTRSRRAQQILGCLVRVLAQPGRSVACFRSLWRIIWSRLYFPGRISLVSATGEVRPSDRPNRPTDRKFVHTINALSIANIGHHRHRHWRRRSTVSVKLR